MPPPARPRPDPLRMAANDSPPVLLARTVSANRMATNPRWVIAAYQRAAGRTSGLWRCSARTSTSDDTAMISQSNSNVDALPAAGTVSRLHTKRGNVACTALPEQLCAV